MPVTILQDTKAKFKTGDKCRFNGRVPDYIAINLRRRTRTITQVYYSVENQCCYYELGDRGKARQSYWFRSYMLIAVNGNKHTIGRPRQKRQYRKHNRNIKVLLAFCRPILGGSSAD